MDIKSTGIDISRWQGEFNMEQAKKEGFQFAIIKGGGADDGLYIDSRFERNYENAKRLGMPVGAYWFSKALTAKDALKEADYFHEHVLKGRQFELPVYMDVEHIAMLDLGKRKLTDIVHAFCQRLEQKNYWAGIYSSQSFFQRYMIDSELQRYAHWVACWDKTCNYTGECFGMWQYGGETNMIRSNKVAGVVCDQNYMLVDYPAMIKARGKNGFSEPEDRPTETFNEGNRAYAFSLAKDGEKYLTKNFQVKEFACQDGSDPVFIHPILADWCQRIRDKFGYAFSPNSAYRTVNHNVKVGGAARSYHLYGLAVDIPAKGNTTARQLYDFAEEMVGDSCELGLYDWGIHLAYCRDKKRFKG